MYCVRTNIHSPTCLYTFLSQCLLFLYASLSFYLATYLTNTLFLYLSPPTPPTQIILHLMWATGTLTGKFPSNFSPLLNYLILIILTRAPLFINCLCNIEFNQETFAVLLRSRTSGGMVVRATSIVETFRGTEVRLNLRIGEWRELTIFLVIIKIRVELKKA